MPYLAGLLLVATLATTDPCTFVGEYKPGAVQPSGSLCYVVWGADLDDNGQWVYLELPHYTIMLAVPIGATTGQFRYTYGNGYAEWYDDDGRDYRSPAYVFLRGEV